MAKNIFLHPNSSCIYRLQEIQSYDCNSRQLIDGTELSLRKFGIPLLFSDRLQLKEWIKKKKVDKAGIYVLYRFNERSRILEVYIGRTKHLKTRIEQHLANPDKHWFTHAVTIESSQSECLALSDLENALYSNFKTRPNVIMHNDKIPEVDNDYGMVDNVLLERTDSVSYVIISQIFGAMSTEFRIRKEILNKDCTVFAFMKSIKGNVSLRRNSSNNVKSHLLKDSLLVIPETLDDNAKTIVDNFMLKTQHKIIVDHSGPETIYKLTADKEITLHVFKLLFGDNLHLWMNSLGETDKLIWK